MLGKKTGIFLTTDENTYIITKTEKNMPVSMLLKQLTWCQWNPQCNIFKKLKSWQTFRGMRVIPLFRIRLQSWWQNMVLEKRFGVALFTFSHHPKQCRTDLFKTYRSCVKLLYLKSFLVPYWSGLEWGQLQLSGHPMACLWRCSSKPCFCMRSKPLPSFTREPYHLDDNIHFNCLLSPLSQTGSNP